MPRFDAPSISMTSTDVPAAVSRQESHLPHGVGVGPSAQFSAFARMRAVVVFPTPRGPENRKAWASLSRGDRILERPGDVPLADHVLEYLGPPFSRQDLITHETLTERTRLAMDEH